MTSARSLFEIILLAAAIAACAWLMSCGPAAPTVIKKTAPAPKAAPAPLARQADAPPMPPLPPVQGPGAVSLCWEHELSSGVWFQIYRSLTPGAKTHPAETKVTQFKNVMFDGLAIGVPHFFQVTAKNDAGVESDPSEEMGYVQPVLKIRAAGGKVFVSFERPVKRANVDYRLQRNLVVDSPGSWKPVQSIERVIAGSAGMEKVEHEIFNEEPTRFFRVFLDVKKEGCNQ